ncbi:hypothetical protein KAR91_71220, partial [Candidatus Pacearchaeota archaeon]|nr:hypothetical protein [Candidatus Pacearchaeota archaeon]
MKHLTSFLLMICLLPVMGYADGLKPVDTHRWVDTISDKAIVAMGSTRPLNYLRDETSTWDEIDPNWIGVSDSTWWVDRGFHRTFAYRDGRAFYAYPRNGIRHTIGTKTVKLIKFDKTDSSWSTLADAGHSETVMEGTTIRYVDIFPGVDKELEYDNGWYTEKFVFHQSARDWLATQGPWANCMIGTATRLYIDSLNLDIYDENGKVNFSTVGRLTDKWLKGRKGDTVIFTVAGAYLWVNDSATDIRVRKWVVMIGGNPFLVEMFDAVSAGGLPEGDISHNATFGTLEEGGITIRAHDQIAGGKYAPSSSGTADSMIAYLNQTGDGNMIQACIYDGTDGDAYTLVDTSAEKAVAADQAWVKFLFIQGGTLTSGTKYLIGVNGELDGGGVDLYWTNTAAATDTLTYINQTYGTWPDPIDPTQFSGRLVSVYCYYTEAGAP